MSEIKADYMFEAIWVDFPTITRIETLGYNDTMVSTRELGLVRKRHGMFRAIEPTFEEAKAALCQAMAENVAKAQRRLKQAQDALYIAQTQQEL